ncbi:Rrf2 family transcriptional regulator [Mycolicibacterium lacusdiani]|uniref:Rrf2 family transcriptional regulator n=1 Tax=Mycolicibacterium lacusdiani TaxID=2895283 RepID=UPI001F2EC225|nr:Rrf2 family transcriptional regulator [Mycolicibacterium lacusdiani]
MATPTNTQFAVAVHVLTYLAGTDVPGPVSSDELAASVNASPVYVRRVLTPLRESGLVASTPGARGGWVLSRAAETMTLAEVWRLVQGDDPVLGLHGPNPRCPTGLGVNRALAALDRELADAVEARLGEVTVADVLRDALTVGKMGRRPR